MSKVDFPTSKEQRDEQTLWSKAGVSVSLRRLLGGESQRPFGVPSCRGAIFMTYGGGAVDATKGM